MASQKELTPANWLITSNDGTNLAAKNTVTGTIFNGTLTNFNIMLAQTPDPEPTGESGGTNYDTLRIR